MISQTTITITVNIATGDKWEGNAEFKLTLPERHLQYLDRNSLATELDTLIDKALADYDSRNSK